MPKSPPVRGAAHRRAEPAALASVGSSAVTPEIFSAVTTILHQSPALMKTTKTNSPTHEAIALRAHEIWGSRGNHHGFDLEIWLEAEQQLIAGSPGGNGGAHATAPAESAPPAEPSPAGQSSATSPDDLAAKASFQKHAARAPQLQHGKNAPKPAPPESGKPLWDRPHSS